MANDLDAPARKVRGGRAGQLEPPDFSFPLVRTRIVEELTAPDRAQAKAIAVVAPTGYGKTVLSSALFEHCRSTGAHGWWIALDDRDNSVERVMDLLEVGLGNPEAEEHPTQALIRGDEPMENRVDALLDAVAQLPDPSIVFIDNLGYCTDETLGYVLDRLVFRTPSSVRFVLSSTNEIPMNLARAKLEGRVREVGHAELSLRVGEVRELLGAELCARLGDAAVDTVLRQTEGWPAAVRLAQIILSAADRPLEALARFSGADGDLSDLLNREVLAGFTPETRQFLLEISLLRSFCVELCRHVTGDAETARHVGQLQRRNVFVIPLDRNRNWYRLHGLFREFLFEEAQRTLSAKQRQQVLERAAEWCERSGLWQDAIDYALAGGSTGLASAVLERVAPMFVRDRGDLRQYIEWIEKLHAGAHEVGWEADFWYVWALVFHRRYDTARQQNERLAQRIERELSTGLDALRFADLKRRVEVIRTCVDTYTDRLTEACGHATNWLAQRGVDDPFNVATVACAAGIHLNSALQFVEARKVMRTAQATIAQANSAYGVGWVSLLSAMIPIFEGDFTTAHNDLLAALSRARAALGDGVGIIGTLALAGAKCAVEMNLDEEARDLLAQGLRRAHTHGIVDTAAVGLDAAVKLWSGRSDDPISIAELRETASGYPPRLALMLSCFLVQRLVRLGRLDDALAEGTQIGLTAHGAERRGSAIEGLETARARELYAAAEIDLLIAAGQLKQAETRVGEETRVAKKSGNVARLVELALNEATIAVCSQNPSPATRHLTRAVGLAARRSILRPFRDRGEMLAGLVNDTKPQAWGFALEEERRFFFEICRGLPLGNIALLDQIDPGRGEKHLLETPTARELELLGLIEAGLSNLQLADRLNVSVATVKWHLYNLYTKLGVSSRSAALARARALNLLVR
ncbi:MAG: LuxR C-terminal-related transcriptional regulator [Panacagrimonas sp.]